MRNPNAVEPTISAVPVSLYRELCGELQAKNGEVNALTLKNQRILDENQQLRQELQRLVQMVMHTHHQVSKIPSADGKFDAAQPGFDPVSEPSNPSPSRSGLKPAAPSPDLNAPAANSLQPIRRMVSANTTSTQAPPSIDRSEWITGTHEPMAQRLFQQGSTMAQGLRGWRLALVISLIILSAFGAGFLIVRPLLTQQANQQAPRR